MKTARIFFVLVGFAPVVVGCASASARLPMHAEGMRYGAACASARERARSSEFVEGMEVPHVADAFLPPLPVPVDVKGSPASVSVRVDSGGYGVQNAIVITGVANQQYATRIRNAVQRFSFRPASLDGCAVDGRAVMTFTF